TPHTLDDIATLRSISDERAPASSVPCDPSECSMRCLVRETLVATNSQIVYTIARERATMLAAANVVNLDSVKCEMVVVFGFKECRRPMRGQRSVRERRKSCSERLLCIFRHQRTPALWRRSTLSVLRSWRWSHNGSSSVRARRRAGGGAFLAREPVARTRPRGAADRGPGAKHAACRFTFHRRPLSCPTAFSSDSGIRWRGNGRGDRR